jgi:hypothetical protein
LYRYCGNNLLRGWDPFGLQQQNLKSELGSDGEDLDGFEADSVEAELSDYGSSDFGSGSDNPAVAGLNALPNVKVGLPCRGLSLLVTF